MGLFDFLTNSGTDARFFNDYLTICELYKKLNGKSSNASNYQQRLVMEKDLLGIILKLKNEDSKQLQKLILKDAKKDEYGLYYKHPDLGSFSTKDNIIEKLLSDIRMKHDYDSKLNDFANLTNQLEKIDVAIDTNTVLKKKTIEEMPEVKISPIGKQFDKEGKLSTYFIVDIETTGLKAETDEIIQLCATKVVDGRIVSYFNTYIKPEKPINKEATKINGITDEMVKDSPTIDQVANSFLEYIGTKPIVGYNISFDLKFLYVSGIDLLSKRKIYDAYALAKGVIKKNDIWSYSLDSIAHYYGVNYPPHDSLYDCIATGMVFEKLLYNKINN